MRRFALFALIALDLVACGRKGPIVAPERRLPQPVADLTGVVSDGAVDLTWTNPGRRLDNSRVRDLMVARVYRAEDAGTGEPKPALLSHGRIPGYTEIAHVRFDSPAPAVVEGRHVLLTDRQGLSYGRRYTYVVTVTDSYGRLSPPSRRLSVTLIAPPEPPRNVTAEAGEREVRLRWEPPRETVDGAPITGAMTYEVLRAGSPDARLEPITRTPTAAPAFTDGSVDNDRTYYYALRAIRMEAGTVARGAPSPRVVATPTKTTAPAPPTRLVATASERTVRLTWTGSPGPDVAAYVIYRAKDDGALERIGTARPPAAAFIDREIPSGTYRYAVTAQDSAARRNESARSNEVTVTVP